MICEAVHIDLIEQGILKPRLGTTTTVGVSFSKGHGRHARFLTIRRGYGYRWELGDAEGVDEDPNFRLRASLLRSARTLTLLTSPQTKTTATPTPRTSRPVKFSGPTGHDFLFKSSQLVAGDQRYAKR